MKRPPRTEEPEHRRTQQRAARDEAPHRNLRRPYVKPRVEEAGSVFSRTRALGGGSKDIINGSSLL